MTLNLDKDIEGERELERNIDSNRKNVVRDL